MAFIRKVAWWNTEKTAEYLPWLSSHSNNGEAPDDEEVEFKTFLGSNSPTDRAWISRKRNAAYWTSLVIVLLLMAVAGFALTSSSSSMHDASSDTPSHSASSHHSHDTPPNAGKKYESCGRTPTEARERGCVFEPQLTAWNPSACVFPEVIEEYTSTVGDMHSDWNWYWDKNLTSRVQPADLDSLRAGNYTAIYTDYASSHPLHCLYCWRKVMYALEHGHKMMDTRCHQFWHAKHCVEHVAGRLQVQQDISLPEKWSYPLMFHDCVELASTTET